MNSSEMEYSIKTASTKSIVEHLYKCAIFFSPPLNTYVDIEEYGKKIFNKAVTFECWYCNLLVGLVGAYFNNNETRTGFITNVSVINQFQGYGIASTLIANTINYAIENEFLEIDMEVDCHNKKASKLYKKHGFAVVRQNEDKLLMRLKLKDNYE